MIYVLPETLKIEGALTPVERYRGIFRAILYGANLRLSGTFVRPDLAALDVRAEDVLWQDATVIVGVSDLRGAASEPALDWAEADRAIARAEGRFPVERAACPGRLRRCRVARRVGGFRRHARIRRQPKSRYRPGRQDDDRVVAFVLAASKLRRRLSAENALDLGHGLLGRMGDLLSRAQLSAGLESHDGDGDAIGAGDLRARVAASQFGVSLLSPVDLYAMSERSVKYGMLFVILILSTIFTYETIGRRRIHLLQYALTGFALCVFFLLLLALSEVIAFTLAYAVAAFMSTALVALYVGKAMASARRGSVIGGLLGGVYGYLYVVLQREDYALLSGALGVFVALAGVMYATRNIDWYAGQQKQADLPAEWAVRGRV